MTLSQMDRACFTVLATLQESRKVSRGHIGVVGLHHPFVLGSYLLEQRSQRRGTTELGSIFRLSLVPYFVLSFDGNISKSTVGIMTFHPNAAAYSPQSGSVPLGKLSGSDSMLLAHCWDS